MVHGRLKERRIPLPSCAYTSIRMTHKPKGEDFTGYVEVETDVDSE